MNKYITYNSDNTAYKIRNIKNFRLPLHKKSASQNSLYNKALKLYNDIPDVAKQPCLFQKKTYLLPSKLNGRLHKVKVTYELNLNFA